MLHVVFSNTNNQFSDFLDTSWVFSHPVLTLTTHSWCQSPQVKGSVP